MASSASGSKRPRLAENSDNDLNSQADSESVDSLDSLDENVICDDEGCRDAYKFERKCRKEERKLAKDLQSKLDTKSKEVEELKLQIAQKEKNNGIPGRVLAKQLLAVSDQLKALASGKGGKSGSFS